MALSPERSTLMYMLVAFYATFFMWYAGWPRQGDPLSEIERERYSKALQGGFDDEVFAGDLENFIENDDGRPFTAVMNIAYRTELDYPENLPENFVEAESITEAIQTLSSGFLWTAVPYASIPIFIMDYSGHVYRASDDDEDEDGEVMQRHGSLETWDQVVALRFRSRRDFLDVVTEAKEQNLFYHKSASFSRMSVVVGSGRFTPLVTADMAVCCIVLVWCFLTFEISGPIFSLLFGDEGDKKKKKKEKKEKKEKDKKDKSDKKTLKSSSTEEAAAASPSPAPAN